MRNNLGSGNPNIRKINIHYVISKEIFLSLRPSTSQQIINFILSTIMSLSKFNQRTIRDEIAIIVEKHLNGKAISARGINETSSRTRRFHNKKFEICQMAKICRKNLCTPLLITETPKIIDNIDILGILTRKYVSRTQDGLTKFTQA